MKKTIEERFWEKVDIKDDKNCWEWTSFKNNRGYPQFKINYKNRQASQISWELKNNKKFPIGLLACHSCDNPGCVNPNHIWPGTPSQNTLDAFNKGRMKNYIHPIKESCLMGHKYDTKNTGIYGTKRKRHCKSCARKRNRERYRKVNNLSKDLYRTSNE